MSSALTAVARRRRGSGPATDPTTAGAPHRTNAAADSWPNRADKAYQNRNQIGNPIGNHQAPTSTGRRGPTTAQQWIVVARTWHAPLRRDIRSKPLTWASEWSGRRESNPHHQLGRLGLCR